MNRSWSAIAFSLGFVALQTSVCALADELDTFNIRLSESLSHDNNLFRLAPNVSPAHDSTNSSARGDNIGVNLVGITFDKSYSLQRFHVGAELANYRFSNHSFLNYQAKNADARWNWSLTPNLDGVISANRNQVLNDFADYRSVSRNVRTSDDLRVSAEYGLHGPWRLVVGANETRIKNSALFQETGDTLTRAGEVGIKYLSSAGNSVGYRLREHRVDWQNRPLDYFNQFDVRARQTDHEVSLGLKPLDKTELAGTVTHIQRRHDTFASRDYDGTAGRFSAKWLPTAKLQFDVTAGREYGAWWDLTGNHTVTDTVALVPAWQLSPKMALHGRIEHSSRDFRGTAILILSGPQRQDIMNSASMSFDWLPLRNLSLGASIQKSRRSSNFDSQDYDDLTGTLSARYNF